MTATVITPTPRVRARMLRPVLVLGVVLLVLAVLTVLVPRLTQDSTALSPDNPAPDGAQALARVLEDHGVDVHPATSAADAASRGARPDTTLVVVFPSNMDDEVAGAVKHAPDIVYIGTEQYYGQLEDGLEPTALGTQDASSTPVSAQGCTAPAGQRAGAVTRGVYGVRADASWQTCFALGEDTWAYAQRTRGAVTRAVIPDSRLVRNARIAEFGNAALALNALGRHDHVVWYVASLGDTLEAGGTDSPPWLLPGLVVLAGAGLALAAALGRRLGRLVPEDLPAHVPAAETVIGRGRLLHASHQHAHAARALRVATATRLAARLGVPRGAPPEQLHAALVRAGVPADRAQDLLWGDPPTTDKDLVALAADLTDLEESIRHD